MHNQFSTDPNQASFSNLPNRLPPIGILDLLVLTAAMAFVFAVQDQMQRMQVESSMVRVPDPNQFFAIARRMVHSIPAGISLAGIYWLIKQKRRTGSFMQQPGHWIFPTRILAYLSMIVVSWFAFRVEPFNDPGLQSITTLLGGLATLDFLAFCLLVVALFYNSGAWRWLIGLLACSYLANAASYFVTMWFLKSMVTGAGAAPAWLPIIQSGIWIVWLVFTFACVLALIVAIFSDSRKRISRDWLHWTALIVFFFEFIVIPIFDTAMNYFVNEPL